MNRTSDASDQEHHDQAQGIHAKTELDVQIPNREPCCPRFVQWSPPIDGDKNDAEDKAPNNSGDGQTGAHFSIPVREEGNPCGAKKRKKENKPG